MASTAFDSLQFVHVLGAMVVVGYLAVIPMWRSALGKDAEPALVRGFLRSLVRVQERLVLPALGVVIVTGILMSYGPLMQGYRLVAFRMWQASLVIALVLAFVLWNGLGAPAKKMLALSEMGEHAGPAMDKLWGEWRTALLSAAVLALVATGIMVFVAIT